MIVDGRHFHNIGRDKIHVTEHANTSHPGTSAFGSSRVSEVTYPREMTTTEADSDFAAQAGLRIEQAFALCSFAAELVGKAR